MDNKFAGYGVGDSAGSGSWKAPSRDIYSAPYPAKVAVGEGEFLEWDSFPPTADMDQKLSWGFGGKAPDISALGAAGSSAQAAGFSSLDSLTNNRNKKEIPAHYRRPSGRGKFCGRWSVSGIDPKTNRKVHRRVNCNSWSCSYCGPRKARTARARIRDVAEALDLKYFLTLTLDPSKLANKKMAVPYLRLCFDKFRLYLKREFGVAPSYICVLEFTKAGIPHLHVLFDRFIRQAWISRVWSSLGGGRIVFIKQVTVRNVARYLSKYLTKELLLSAPKGARRITTARSIKLFPKFNSGIAWALHHHSIYRALEDANAKHFFTREQDLFRYIEMEFDEERFLKKFEVVQEC